MNVQDGVRKSINKHWAEDSHKASETHKAHASLSELLNQGTIVISPVVAAVIQDDCFDARVSCSA
jgi:hypothetical protein